MWKVTLFKNTGMNSGNTIDNPSRLFEQQSIVDSVDLPPLDILQAEFLSSIKVRATRDQVKNADFLMLKNTEDSSEVFFYSVESFNSTSFDVQVLPVTFDGLLTLENMVGGIENIEFLDGIVERHHVNKSNDTYGAYTEDDPLLVPSKELGLIAVQMYNPVYSATGGGNDVIPKTMVQSRVKLTTIGRKAETYTDATSGEKTTIPKAPETVKEPTQFYLPLSDGDGQMYANRSAQCFDFDHSATLSGLDELRSLGIERSSIIASYVLVQNFDYVGIGGQPGFTMIKGVYHEKEMNDGFEFEYDNEVQNKRVLYGNCNMYEIISVASGVRMEFKPEDLCLKDDGTILRKPIVCRTSDPRPEGRPYYGFKYYRGINQMRHNYFSNIVPGMQWPSMPIVYTGLSGSQLNEIRYATEREGAALAAQQQIDTMNYNLGESHTRRTIDILRGGVSAIGNTIANPGSALSNISGYANTVLNAQFDQAFDESRSQFEKSQLEDRYAYNARKELQELKIGNTIVAPDVHFPNSETLRDFLGNGIYVIQYRPQASDRKKMDRILTMYGYKDTKVLENSDFSGRSKFNYVKANSVSIGNKNVPAWIREAAAAQLANGVRVWHQLPDVTAYSDGTNV